MSENLVDTRDRMVTYSRSIVLEATPERVFGFCSSRVGFVAHYPNPILAYRGPDHWTAGSEFWLDYRYMGLAMTWHGKVTEFEPNQYFKDLMLAGMFRYWEHTHVVEPAGTGTKYTDSVRFSLGLGRWIDRLFVKPSLEKFFERRHELLRSALQGNTWNVRPAAEQRDAARGV